MKQVVTSREIKEIEQCAIQEIGIPSLVLMERAALSVSEQIRQHFFGKDKICIVCGSGNNGADGVAIARQLLEASYSVTVVVLGKEEKFSEEMNIQLSILEKMGVAYLTKIPKETFDCFVDAIFGVGLSREIMDESILDAIDTINSSDAYIYSVDIPSGICTDSGRIMGRAVKANETITFSYGKVGLYLHPGKAYAGKVHIKEIGILPVCDEKSNISHLVFEETDGARLLKRNPDGNKGTFGKVVVIAGSDEMSGASILCAKAVLKSGAGMVKVLSTDKNLDIIRETLPEAMVQSIDDMTTMDADIQEAVKWGDCIVIGPGIGMKEEAYRKIHCVLKDFPSEKRLVIDADGINLISKYEELKKMTKIVNNMVYTPHLGELSRLTGYPVADLKSNLDAIMEEVCRENNAIYVCKDSVTRIYGKQKPVYINNFGNSGMATAGSGDVLAGILAANLAKKGMDIYEGCALSVYLHSVAGDLAAKESGQNALLAGDIIDAMPKVLKNMEEVS